MSAFLVEDKTINIIVTRLWKDLNNSYYLRKELRNLDMDMNMDAQGNMINENLDRYFSCFAEAMFDLNVKSIKERYTRNSGDLIDSGFKFEKVYDLSRIWVLKALNCFLYQSCEGLCVYTPLYRFLDRVYKPFLQGEIIRSLPEYDNAPMWR